MSPKTQIKSFAARMGFEIRRVMPSGDASMPRNGLEVQQILLEKMGIDQPLIFDIGARYGGTTARYRELIPDAKIYAFEPFSDSFHKAQSRHRDDSGVVLTQAAVSDIPGTRAFYTNDSNDEHGTDAQAVVDGTHSLLPRPSEGKRYYPENAELTNSVDVSVITLDGFVEREAIEKINVLKMDIQGGELMALKGGQRLLDNQRVDLIYTEVSLVPHYEDGPLFDEIWSHLRGFGYSLYSLFDIFFAADGQVRQADALFVTDRVRSEVIEQL